MAKQNVAIIGAGNSGHAMAVDLTLRGFKVNLWNRSPDKLEKIRAKGGVQAVGAVEGFTRLNLLTNDMGECVQGCELIFSTIPADGHREVVTQLANFLADNHILVLCPGRTGGAIEAWNILRSLRPDISIPIAETQTIAYTCRLEEIGFVSVMALKNRVALAALPCSKTSLVLQKVSDLLPYFFAASNVLETSFSNVGSILHPAPLLSNIGWIEAPDKNFKYYYEGISPTISRFLAKMDKERLAVARGFGIEVQSVVEWYKDAYDVEGSTIYECVQKNRKYESLYAPSEVQCRYVLEDVPTGLVPISELGRMVGVKTPLMDVLIRLAEEMLEIDFRRIGRNLVNLGIDSYSPEQLLDMVTRYGYEFFG